MSQTNLDLEVLRTLITVQQLSRFNGAAKRVGRAQSAVSQEIRKRGIGPPSTAAVEPGFPHAGRLWAPAVVQLKEILLDVLSPNLAALTPTSAPSH